MDYTYIFVLLLITILIIFTPNRETFSYYLGQPSKCFDCERELPIGLKYLGGPSKCFDCEMEYKRRYGGRYSDLAQPTKCFNCENQFNA